MAGLILGTKSVVGQHFSPEGNRVAYTKINTSSCFLVGVKTVEQDGYNAAIISAVPTKNIKKSRVGLLKKAGIETPLRFLREIRLDKLGKSFVVEITDQGKKKALKIGEYEFAVGEELKTDSLFAVEDKVVISSRSKGKGFAGVVKRHGFAGGPATHGQSDRERAPGSIGQTTTPGRVYKGKRMAGRMGNQMTTIKNAKVVEVSDKHISVTGFVPGVVGSLVVVKTM